MIVSIEKIGLEIGIEFEIRIIVANDLLSLPWVVSHVWECGLDVLAFPEDELKIVSLHLIYKIDILTHFALVLLISNEQNSGESAIA